MSDHYGVLRGIRVLDFGRYVAGPFCAALLGDMGADVIRVEAPSGGEDRTIQPLIPDAKIGEGGEGSLFIQMNRNKRGMTINPRHPSYKDIIKRLIARSDIVVANLPPGALEKLGLDDASIRSINPRIILTHVTAFGLGGPYRDKVGFDAVAQAMCGSAHLTGNKDMPMRCYTAWVDCGTAVLAALGAVTALLHRERTGEGQVVTGSLLSTALSFFSFHIMEEYTRNLEREAIGNRSPYGAPVDMISTKDGWIAVQVLGQGIFKRWAHMMGREDLLENPKFRNDLARGDHGGEISSILHVWARQYTNAEALDILEKARIPSGPVYAPVDIMKDKHIQEMGCFQGLDFPGVSKAPPLVETPVQLSQNKNTIRTRAPLLGEHTKDILKSLGYDDHHIAGFYQEGAV